MMIDTSKMTSLDEELEEFEQEDSLEDLAMFVHHAAQRARDHRIEIGVEEDMHRARRAVQSKYDPEDYELLDHNAIYMGITNLKVRAFRSWVSDIIINAEDKPWTLKPSPMPDMPRDIEDIILDKVMEEIASAGFDGTIVERLTTLKHLAKSHIEKVTTEAAMRMEQVISDQLLEGGWRVAFDEFIDDLGTMPSAILKGPVVEYRKRMRWSDGGTEVVEVPMYSISRVDPMDLYPSPDSTDIDDGAYIVHRVSMTSRQLLNTSNLSGFREASIRAVMHDNPTGWEWDNFGTDIEEELDGVDMSDTPDNTSNTYDAIVYYGQIDGELLSEWGLDVDPTMTHEAEVWVVGNYAIRAILNPYPLGRRPFYMTSFDKSPGSFWGSGLPKLLRDVQRVGNASVRALVKNMAFSAGPIGEYDAGRLSMEEDITEVTPYRMFSVDSDPIVANNLPAFRFHNVASNSNELMGIYERFMKQADDISGIPAYVLGNPQVAGAGRTLGGLSLLMGNAAKGIKKVISQVDKDVIEPLIETYVAMNLLYNPDDTIKFDTHVVARGSSGLLQRELSQSRSVEVLQMLTPYAQAGIVPAKGLQIVLRDVIRGLGYSADEVVPDPQREEEIAELIRSQAAGAAAQNTAGMGPNGAFLEQETADASLPVEPSLQQGTPPPELDGRSQAPSLPSGLIPPSQV